MELATRHLLLLSVQRYGLHLGEQAPKPLQQQRRRSSAQRLFKAPFTGRGSWDVAADGKRFLIAVPPAASPASRPYHVVVNWTELLKR